MGMTCQHLENFLLPGSQEGAGTLYCTLYGSTPRRMLTFPPFPRPDIFTVERKLKEVGRVLGGGGGGGWEQKDDNTLSGVAP